jgi:hypothetical protein
VVQVLCSVVKWCWARLPGGVVSWDAYELFRQGEQGMFWKKILVPGSSIANR